MEATYTVVLMRGEDGGYSVSVPALKGCYTQGDNVDDALANAREAIQCHVEALAMDGDPIPQDAEAFDVEVDEATEVLVRRVTVGGLLAVA